MTSLERVLLATSGIAIARAVARHANRHSRSSLAGSRRARVAVVSLFSVALLTSTFSVTGQPQQAQAQSWSQTGSLATGRFGHTSTLLANGKVLVVGGRICTGSNCTEFSSAEVYDPATGLWSAAGNMSVPRHAHVSVRLQNGKVLVAGGFSGATTWNSAELYDPETGLWSPVGNLAAPRAFATATLLASGKVLVAGGGPFAINDASLSSAELFDPATGSWISAGTMNAARRIHGATLLTDGRVLVTSGMGGRVTTDFFGYSDTIQAISVRPNGRIVAAGACRTTEDADSARFALAQYNADGTIDAGFGSAALEAGTAAIAQEAITKPGTTATDFFGYMALATSLTFQPDGRIVLAGTAQAAAGYQSAEFALARYEPNGSLDTSFGNGGKVVTDFYHSADSIAAIAMLGDKIVAAGKAIDDSDAFNQKWDFALARYLPGDKPDFALDLSPQTVIADRGTTEVVRVLINRTGAFSSSVTVTPPDASAIKVKVKPGAEVPSVDDSVKFKLKVKGSASTGTHQLIFSATDGAGRTRAATLALVIQ